jgi:Xaa-Pro aminopeptidase
VTEPRPAAGPSAASLGERAAGLRAIMEQEELGALLVFGLKNIRYLTGFSGTAGVLLALPDELILISDFRYRLRAREEAPGARFVEVNDHLKDHLPGLLQDAAGTVGVEDSHLTVQTWRRLEEGLQGRDHRFVNGRVERLRMVKSPEEIEALRQSGSLVSRVIASLRERPVVGLAERELAFELETFARREGSDALPFDFIVAAGPRGAMPHAEPSREPVAADGLLVVDIGTSVAGYSSDMTRTFATGRLSEKEKEIYDLVRQAQEAGRAAVRPGVACAQVDQVARDLIAEAGYGDYFQHSLGHGVGLEVHEAPRLSSSSDEVLEVGMVVTVEPGIYLPDLGGVRIEDTVLVTPQGAESLTSFDRGLVTVG